jgi:hypothetical protein
MILWKVSKHLWQYKENIMSIFADSMKSRHHEINFESDIWAVRKHAPIKPSRMFIHDYVYSNNEAEDNLNKLGYIIPAWCDIKISVDKKGNKTVEYSDYNLEKQTFAPGENIVLENAWRVWTKPNYSIMCLPVFFDNANFMASPGVYDKDINSSELPVEIVLNEDTDTLIEMGQPLVQVIPFKREKFKASSASLSENTIKRDRALTNQKRLSFNRMKQWLTTRTHEAY